MSFQGLISRLKNTAPSPIYAGRYHNHPPGYVGGETCEGCRKERGLPTLAEVKQDWAPYR